MTLSHITITVSGTLHKTSTKDKLFWTPFLPLSRGVQSCQYSGFTCFLWRRISFSSLTQVAFGNKFFSFIYCTRDEERNLQEKKVTAYVFNHTLAKSLFRSVTEDQVFHYQNTVTPLVLNHADNRETIWRVFCRKVILIKPAIIYNIELKAGSLNN